VTIAEAEAETEADFRASVRDVFAFLKRTSELDQLLARGLPLQDGWLLPAADLHVGDPVLIEALGRWRSAHADTFPTQFKVTSAGTAKWLAEAVVSNPDRLLMLVADRLGRPIGHVGVTLSADARISALLEGDRLLEFGYLLRGETAPAGIMADATRTLISWCHEQFAPFAIYSVTFEHNRGAVGFCEAAGGVVRDMIPLARHAGYHSVEYRRAPPDRIDPPDARHVVMTWPELRPADSADAIPVAGPSIGPREVGYVLDAVRSGWYERRSEYAERFADAFARIAGVRFAIPTSSCTGAMHLALLALGIGAGDEVIVPELSWVATANVVALTGATPVFVDVDPISWCLHPEALREAIGPRTRAVVPVHLYGHPAPMPEIRSIADEHGLQIVEDAAAAAGAELAGRRAGSWGGMAAFSLQGAKLVMAGEGGMLVTDDEALYARAAHLWDQARTGAGAFWCDAVTPKYKLSNIQAALGLAQVERIDWLIAAKSRIHQSYVEQLRGVAGASVHLGDPAATATHWMTSLLVGDAAALSRDDLARELARRGIDTRPVFPPLSTLPMWPPGRAPGENAARIAAQGLNLPSGVTLSGLQLERVAGAIRELLSP
jgi:perosamine synthetase